MVVVFIKTFKGLNQREKPLALSPEYQKSTDNCIPLPRGAGRRPMWGYEKTFTASAAQFSAAPCGCFSLEKADGTTEKLWIADRKLYKQTASGVSSLTSSIFASSGVANFVQWKHKAIILQAGVDPRIYDPASSTVSSLGFYAACSAYPTVGVEYRSILWLTGAAEDPNRVWGCKLNDPYTWINSGAASSTAGAFFIDVPFQPNSITKGFDFLQLRGQNMSKKLTGILADDGVTSADNTFRFEDAFYIRGTTAHKTVINVGNDQIYLSKKSIVSMNSIQEQIGLAFNDLSENIEPYLSGMRSQEYQSKAFSILDEENGYIFVWYVQGTGTVPNRVAVYDIQGGGWGTAKITAECGMNDRGTVYIGGSDGFIYTLSPDLYSYNGSDITSVSQDGWIDFDTEDGVGATRNKKIKKIVIGFEANETDATIDVYLYSDTSLHQYKALSGKVVEGSLWGSGIFGVTVTSKVVQKEITLYPNSICKRFGVQFIQKDNDKIVQILGYKVEAEHLGR